MLYRYPIEQKKTAQEIVTGNRRYDAYTGEELPPVPYINTVQPQKKQVSGSGNQTKGGAVKTSAGTGAAAQSRQTVQSELDRQKALLLKQQQEALEKQYANGRNTLKNNYEAQLAAAQMSSDDIMRQLYVAYMQGIKNMSQQQALRGAGGEIESLKSRQRINYENNRAKQNSSYNGIISEIQQRYNSDLMELEEKYLRQLMNL